MSDLLSNAEDSSRLLLTKAARKDNESLSAGTYESPLLREEWGPPISSSFPSRPVAKQTRYNIDTLSVFTIKLL